MCPYTAPWMNTTTIWSMSTRSSRWGQGPSLSTLLEGASWMRPFWPPLSKTTESEQPRSMSMKANHTTWWPRPHLWGTRPTSSSHPTRPFTVRPRRLSCAKWQHQKSGEQFWAAFPTASGIVATKSTSPQPRVDHTQDHRVPPAARTPEAFWMGLCITRTFRRCNKRIRRPHMMRRRIQFPYPKEWGSGLQARLWPQLPQLLPPDYLLVSLPAWQDCHQVRRPQVRPWPQQQRPNKRMFLIEEWTSTKTHQPPKTKRNNKMIIFCKKKNRKNSTLIGFLWDFVSHQENFFVLFLFEEGSLFLLLLLFCGAFRDTILMITIFCCCYDAPGERQDDYWIVVIESLRFHDRNLFR